MRQKFYYNLFILLFILNSITLERGVLATEQTFSLISSDTQNYFLSSYSDEFFFLDKLPNELMPNILNFMDGNSLKNFAVTCKKNKELAAEAWKSRTLVLQKLVTKPIPKIQNLLCLPFSERSEGEDYKVARQFEELKLEDIDQISQAYYMAASRIIFPNRTLGSLIESNQISLLLEKAPQHLISLSLELAPPSSRQTINLDGLRNLSNLKELSIEGLCSFSDTKFLPLTKLTFLMLREGGSHMLMSPQITPLISLKKLSIAESCWPNEMINGLNLSTLINLETLLFWFVLPDLRSLNLPSSLRSLNFIQNYSLKISSERMPLPSILERLTYFSITDPKTPVDITPAACKWLGQLTNLAKLELTGCNVTEGASLEALQNKLPKTTIVISGMGPSLDSGQNLRDTKVIS